MRTQLFFLGALYQKFFCFTLSLHWWYSIPRLVWFGQLLTRWKKPIFKIPFSRNSQNSVRKANFFPRPALPIFLLYTLITLVILHTAFGLIWTTPLPDEKNLFLNSFFAKFAKFRTKSQFFSEASSTNFFALHSHYTGDTPYRVWFDLDNSLTRWKKPIFNIPFSRNSQNSVRKPNLFPRPALPIFLLITLITLVILHTAFGLIWTTPLPDEKNLFLNSFFAKFAKFRTKSQFFSEASSTNFFALHSHYTGDTPYRVWFDLDNSLTRWKKPFFNIPFSRNSQNSVRKPNLFPRPALPIFLLITLITLVILHTAFGLIWTTPLPDEKNLFLNSFFAKFAKFRTKSQFFSEASSTNFFALHSHYTGDTPYRVWFDLDNSLTRWKKPIFNIPFSRNSQNSVRKPNFFPRPALPIFLLITLITLVILHTAFGLIWTTP